MPARHIRIIGGTARGRKLWGPDDRTIRPATGIVKEYIFNIIYDTIEGSTIADLFAGTGNLGIEAISRGAKNVAFVDRSPDSITLIRRNLRDLQFLHNNVSVLRMDAIQFLGEAHKKEYTFDIIFADPPFGYEPLFPLIETVGALNILKPGGFFIVRYNCDIQNMLPVKNMHQIKYRKFGENKISTFQQGVFCEASDISRNV